jgi:dephospho-CoA kinase
MVHPRVREHLQRALVGLKAPYAIIMAPLLIEARMTDLVDRVLVVDSPEALQLQRAQQRDGHDAAHLARILAAQTDRATRLAAADDIIVNDGDLAALRAAVARLHQRYLAAAAQP